MNVSYSNYPDWDMLKIKKRKNKIDFLKKLKETSVNQPIILYPDKDTYYDDTLEVIDPTNDINKIKVIGIITSATVDDKNLCLNFKGLLFGNIGLEIFKENNGEYSYGGTSIYYDFNKINELFRVSDAAEEFLKEVKNKMDDTQEGE